MVHPCDKPCGNKTASGYCATTVCINPQFSNIGTAQYGQGVQKNIVTNADKIRAMTDEELADLIGENIDCAICKSMNGRDFMGECPIVGVSKWPGKECHGMWLDWLREEAKM